MIIAIPNALSVTIAEFRYGAKGRAVKRWRTIDVLVAGEFGRTWVDTGLAWIVAFGA